MKKELLNQIKQDKLFDYLKENTNYIKELNRNSAYYKTFKKEIKDKYKLNFTDKAKEVINDIEIISNIISTLN